jgi:hypothetical protein
MPSKASNALQLKILKSKHFILLIAEKDTFYKGNIAKEQNNLEILIIAAVIIIIFVVLPKIKKRIKKTSKNSK